jgi:hypothetical protein
MRIDTDLTDDDRKLVKEYANENGLKMSRAYTDLIRAGLRAEQDE